MAQIAILARFLSPNDFGLMALATVLIGLSQALSDGGISNAIVQNQNMKRQEYHSLYWFNVMLGGVICALLNICATPIAWMFGHDELASIIHWISLIFIIQPWGQQYRMVMQKHMEFNRLAIVTIVTKLVVFCVSCVLAMNGFGVYALVYAAIIDAVIVALMLVVLGVRHHCPSWYFSLSDVQPYISFGAYQTGERFINLFAGQCDKILIGYFLGVSALGYYNLAWQLIVFPVQKLNPIVTQVMFPIYSKLQNQKDKIAQYFWNTLGVLSLVTIPFFVILGVFSMSIVELIYGQGWEVSATLVPWLVIVGLSKVLLNPIGSLFVALGRVDITFKVNLILSSVTMAALWVGLWLVPSLNVAPQILGALSIIFAVTWFVVVQKHIKVRV